MVLSVVEKEPRGNVAEWWVLRASEMRLKEASAHLTGLRGPLLREAALGMTDYWTHDPGSEWSVLIRLCRCFGQAWLHSVWGLVQNETWAPVRMSRWQQDAQPSAAPSGSRPLCNSAGHMSWLWMCNGKVAGSSRCFCKCRSCVVLWKVFTWSLDLKSLVKSQLLHFLLIKVHQRNRAVGDFILYLKSVYITLYVCTHTHTNEELACAVVEAEKSPNLLSVGWRSGKPVA